MYKIGLVLGFIFSVVCSFAQQLPIDSKVKTGILENGLTYYIRNNSSLKGKADLYLVCNVGAILEEDHEDGMAHFLEHMAFNGSENFPGNMLREYLEEKNVNWNAYTTLERTVYYLNNIPVEDASVVDSCLLVAHDWSGFLSMDEKAIEKERNIIREEKRLFSGSDFRIVEALKKEIIPYSKYVERNVIGKEDTFMNFTSEQIRNFYNKWYRPDMQAVIIVGDIQPEVIESKLIEIFSDIPFPAVKIENPELSINDNTNPVISIVADKEVAFPTFDIEFRCKPLSVEEKESVDGFVNDYLIGIITAMINERLETVIGEAGGYLNEISASYDNFLGIGSEESLAISLKIGNGKTEESIKSFLTEVIRINQHGFSQTEYERAKLVLTSQYKKKFDEKDKTENAEYAEKYMKHFIYGNYIPGIELECQLLMELMPQVTLQMVNEHVQELMIEKNTVVYLVMPQEAEHPQKETISDWLISINNQNLDPYMEKTNNEPLLTILPVAGKIINEEIEPVLGTVNYKLSNGATVVIKQTDFKNNEVLFYAVSPGGSSLFPEEEIANIKLYEEVADLGGLGDFNKMDIQKKLAGKEVNVIPFINPIADGLKGLTINENLEELLQLVYMQFTSPRMDEDAFSAFMEKKKNTLQDNDPKVIFNNAVRRAAYGNTERMLPITSDDLLKVDYQRIFEWRKDRYADASDFTFIFTGNIDPDSSRELIERYLASLPSLSVKESAVNVNIALQPGHIKEAFEHKMENPQAVVTNLYSANVEFNLMNRITLDVLVEILNNSLTETLREQEGGVYALFVSGNISDYPKGQAILEINFPTEPGKEEQLNSLVKMAVNNMRLNGPTNDELQKAVTILSNKHNENIRNNAYWISNLAAYYAVNTDNMNGYMDILNSIHGEDIKSLASKITKDNLVEVIMKGI